ncbi:MAG TPA: hypothetical protein VGM56_13700 [Byssovorax sp.]|jgi:hypothetical protein
MRPSDDDLFTALPDVVRLPLGASGELLYAPLTRAAHLASIDTVRSFLACLGFATLDAHAARGARQGRAAAAVRADLAALAEAGLLVSRAELARRLDVAPESRSARIGLVGVPTRDRPESLRAALEGYVANAARHERALTIAVFDQSSTDARRAATRDVASRASDASDVAVRYVGARDVEAFAARLAARAEVSRDVVDFAVANPERCPFTVGASRNAMMLLGAGGLLAMADDDTRCLVAPAPFGSPGVAVTSRSDPSEHAFPDDGATAIAADVDVWSLHESLLGARPGDATREASAVELDGVTSMFFRRVEGGARVVTTQLGCAGDAATGSMHHLLTLGGASRARLLVSEATYRRAMMERRVVRAASRPTVGDGAGFMSTCVGLDARALLPPFFPVQRNGDGVFGLALRVTSLGALSGWLPWTVGHAPPESRATSMEAALDGVGRMSTGDVVWCLVLGSRVEADSRDPSRALVALGDTLARWGALPLGEFEEIARLHALRARARDLAMLGDLVAAHRGAPAFWARDVERVRLRLTELVTHHALAHPVDLCAAFGDVEGRHKLRTLVRRYGELLRAWPALSAAARELRAERGDLAIA